MSHAFSKTARFGRTVGIAGRWAGMLVIGASLMATQATAQQNAGKQDAAANTAAQSPWVKLCEKARVRLKGPDGKDGVMLRELCLTTHEQLNSTTGLPVISAAIRQSEGSDKRILAIMVPLGMVIPAGMRAAFVNKTQWDAAIADEQLDDKQLKVAKLNFVYCYAAGCTAEVEATDQIVNDMKAGAGILVRAVDIAGRAKTWGVPLKGFTAALDGPPTDNKQYAAARQSFIKRINEQFEAQRQAELAKDPKLSDAYEKLKSAQQELANAARERAAAAQKTGSVPEKK